MVVGVNQFVEPEERELSLLRITPEVEADQKARLAAFRSRRDQEAVARKLDTLRGAAGGRENLMPLILDAVKAHATVGEISNAFRDAFGEHRDTHLF